jgi:hypothetical protein
LKLARALVHPATLGVLALLLAGGASALGLAVVSLSFNAFCRIRHQDVVHGSASRAALYLVLVAGITGAVALPFVRKRRPLFLATLIAGAASVGLGVGLVASDSATYVQRMSFFDCPGETDASRLDFLYTLWGVSLAVLLVQTARALRRRSQ